MSQELPQLDPELLLPEDTPQRLNVDQKFELDALEPLCPQEPEPEPDPDPVSQELPEPDSLLLPDEPQRLDVHPDPESDEPP